MKATGFIPEAAGELNRALAASPYPLAFERVLAEALRDVASGLRVHPNAGGTRCRECLLPGLPYLVIYDETDDTIRVIALAHHRRRRGYWKDRLSPPTGPAADEIT